MKNFKIFKQKYLLIEDLKNEYQPFFKEYTKTPELCLDSSPLCCPFQKGKIAKSGPKKFKVKAGFCEICYVKYSDYNQHVNEYEHREFAIDNLNYEKIDKLINESVFDNYIGNQDFSIISSSPLDRFSSPTVQCEYGKIYNRVLHISKISSENEEFSNENFLTSISLNTSK